MHIIHIRGYYTVLLFLICALCLLSCTTVQGNAAIKEQPPQPQTQPQPQAAKLGMTQLIIKFRNVNFDPSQGDYLQILSRDIGATLVYLRPMSGGAHVFRVMDITGNEQLTAVIRRLAERADILYVEQDSIMLHQQMQ
jgi:hypothetical protein